MSPIFTRACRSGPGSWYNINSVGEDMLVNVMEFSERPPRGGLSLSVKVICGLTTGLRDFPDRSFDVFASRANESKQLVAGALCFYSK